MNVSGKVLQFGLLFGVALVVVTSGYSQEKKDDAKQRNQKRLKVMSSVIQAFDIKPSKPDSGIATRFNKKPIMRYSDAARGVLDATFWKLGGSGRPQAIVSLEWSRREGDLGVLTYEFLSLTPKRFTLRTNRGWLWNPASTTLAFRRALNTPQPAKTSALRLLQMKELARRFTITEKLGSQDFALRLLPQPIDQYVLQDGAGSRKGTVFFFVYGTNPEVMLLVEPVDDTWQYGLARLSAASLTGKLDEDVVWTKKNMGKLGYSWARDYTANRHGIKLP